jgi:hypothetical protein
MTPSELAAWNDLIGGELGPLADLLEEGNAEVHPVVQRWLVKLIRGTTRDTDFRLAVIRHPDLNRASDGLQAQRRASLERLRTALVMFRAGALEQGQWDAAVVETIQKTGSSRATIAAHWSDQRAFIRFCRSREIIKP